MLPAPLLTTHNLHSDLFRPESQRPQKQPFSRLPPEYNDIPLTDLWIHYQVTHQP
jgi:hypothetical protein